MGKTSWQVKQKYNERVYARIGLQLDRDLVERFKKKCADLEISQASVLKEAIERFLQENDSCSYGERSNND